jgi:uncharacterized protein (TIGR01319 family)
MAEYISAAEPRPRLGMTYSLPLIYAGNTNARDQVTAILGRKTALVVTDNIRPTLEKENLAPARNKIHDLFLEHVMAQAPGYKKLISWAGAPIVPTPAAVGFIMEALAKRDKINLIGVDIGGATTDVFSVYDGVFNRTVSANLGMSYSISNVLAEAGLANIMRWVPFDVDEQTLRNRIKNKMIRPTTVPCLLEDLKIEQAIAREALRLAFIQHKQLAVGLKGVQRGRTISESFDESASGASIINMMDLNLLIGSGGVLSHAPRRCQAMMMLIDAFGPEGVTRIAVDSIFMMPHLGVLAQVSKLAATEVFNRDCLIHLGTCIAAASQVKPGHKCFDYRINVEGKTRQGSVQAGQIVLEPLGLHEVAEVAIEPARWADVGAGPGKTLEAKVHGGVGGLALDGRGRPLEVPKTNRSETVARWAKAFDAYPA